MQDYSNAVRSKYAVIISAAEFSFTAGKSSS
jgi:hypothetical protein